MMLNDPLFLFAAVACLVVLAILAFGIHNFGRGGNPQMSNKLMRWRIGAQAVAVVAIVLFAYLRSKSV